MSILRKTFGGLTIQYLIRQYIFSFIIFFIMYKLSTYGGRGIGIGMLLFYIVNTILYPYARWIYELCAEYIFGNNFFIVNALLLLTLKTITMFACWFLAIFIAPIGLIFLYFYHTKQENKLKDNEE